MRTAGSTLWHAVRTFGTAYLCYRLGQIACLLLVVRNLEPMATSVGTIYATPRDLLPVIALLQDGGRLLALAVILASAIRAMVPRTVPRTAVMLVTACALAPVSFLATCWLLGSYSGPLGRLLGPSGLAAVGAVVVALGPLAAGALIPAPRLSVFRQARVRGAVCTAIVSALVLGASLWVDRTLGGRLYDTMRVHYRETDTLMEWAPANTATFALLTAYCLGLVSWWTKRDEQSLRPAQLPVRRR